MTENEALQDIIKSGINLGAGDYVDPEALKIAVKALKEIQQYRAIGTIEECREARERKRAKKPVDEYMHCISKVHQGNCPICGNYVCADLCNITPMKYCQYCGQAIDWSE